MVSNGVNKVFYVSAVIVGRPGGMWGWKEPTPDTMHCR